MSQCFLCGPGQIHIILDTKPRKITCTKNYIINQQHFIHPKLNMLFSYEKPELIENILKDV